MMFKNPYNVLKTTSKFSIDLFRFDIRKIYVHCKFGILPRETDLLGQRKYIHSPTPFCLFSQENMTLEWTSKIFHFEQCSRKITFYVRYRFGKFFREFETSRYFYEVIGILLNYNSIKLTAVRIFHGIKINHLYFLLFIWHVCHSTRVFYDS